MSTRASREASQGTADDGGQSPAGRPEQDTPPDTSDWSWMHQVPGDSLKVMMKSDVYSLNSKVRHLPYGRRAFTLLELLIVVTIIGVLMALLIPAFSKVRNAALEKQAAIEKTIIGSAIAAYRLQNRGALPAAEGVYGDGEPDGNNSQVMTELLATAPPVLDENKLRFDNQGNVLNPWGNQYKIRLGGGPMVGFDEQASVFYTEVVYTGMP